MGRGETAHLNNSIFTMCTTQVWAQPPWHWKKLWCYALPLPHLKKISSKCWMLIEYDQMKTIGEKAWFFKIPSNWCQLTVSLTSLNAAPNKLLPGSHLEPELPLLKYEYSFVSKTIAQCACITMVIDGNNEMKETKQNHMKMHLRVIGKRHP